MDKNPQKEYKYEKWQAGIADAPEDGFANIRNCNVERYPGSVMPGWQTVSTVSSSSVFTSIAATNYSPGAPTYIQFGTNAFTPYNTQQVSFSATSGGLTAGTVYFLTTVGFVGGVWTAQLALTLANAQAGTPVVTLSGTLTANISSINMSTIMDFRTYYPAVLGLSSQSDTPRNFAIDSNSRVWYQDNTGIPGLNTLTQGIWYNLSKSDDPNTSMGAQSIELFTGSDGKVWLIATRQQNVDAIRVDNLSNASVPSWTTNFTSGTANLTSNFYHKQLFASSSQILYITDGRFLFSVLEVGGQNFDPTNTSTFTVNNKALITPANEVLNCLEQLTSGSTTFILAGSQKSNIIYSWDQVNVFFSTIRCGESGIFQLKNINNIVYILAGVRGIIYYTTGYSVLPLKKIPEYITGGSVQWGGIEKIDGNLLFGFLGTQGDANGNQNGGVGKLFLTEQAYLTSAIPQGSLVIDQTVASGSITTNVTALLTYILPVYSGSATPFETYFLGSSNGVDVVNYGTTRSDGSSYVECPLEHVSSVKAVATLQSTGLELSQPLSSTQSIDVQYRTAINGSYVTALTNPFSVTNPGQGTLTHPFESTNISSVNIVQLKLVLNSDGSRDPIVRNLYLQ